MEQILLYQELYLLLEYKLEYYILKLIDLLYQVPLVLF